MKRNRCNNSPRFSLGKVYSTPGALEALEPDEVHGALARHAQGDWGDVPLEDAQENELSVREGFRILSSYTSRAGVRFWVITEADRSTTTLLLPSEY